MQQVSTTPRKTSWFDLLFLSLLVGLTLLLLGLLILRMIHLMLMMMLYRVHYLGCSRLRRRQLRIITPTNPRAPFLHLITWGRVATFSACALPIVVSLPPVSLSGLLDISTQYFKKQKINDFFHRNIVSFLTIQQQQLNFDSVILICHISLKLTIININNQISS